MNRIIKSFVFLQIPGFAIAAPKSDIVFMYKTYPVARLNTDIQMTNAEKILVSFEIKANVAISIIYVNLEEKDGLKVRRRNVALKVKHKKKVYHFFYVSLNPLVRPTKYQISYGIESYYEKSYCANCVSLANDTFYYSHGIAGNISVVILNE